MRTKKSITGKMFIFFTLFLLMLGSCQFSFDEVLPPEGMGAFSLNIGGSAHGRTIMPEFGGGEGQQQITWYRLIFTPTASGSAVTALRHHENLSAPVNLPTGSYTLRVYAYINKTDIGFDENGVAIDGQPDRPMARGEYANVINIIPGTVIGGTIVLVPFGALEDGTGIFSWEITLSRYLYQDLYKAWIDITPFSLNSDTPALQTWYLVGGDINYQKSNTDQTELPTGFYSMTITLEKDPSFDKRPVVWSQMLHIHKNLTSHFTGTFTTEHFLRRSYMVTFNYNYTGAEASLMDGTYFFDHFSELNETERNAYNPSRSGFLFTGWCIYRDCANANCTHTDTNIWGMCSETWNFPQLSGPTTLYARWFSAGGSVTNTYNSNNLIYIEGAERGWWLQAPIEGRWVTGYMDETEGAPIDIPMMADTFTFQELGGAGFADFTRELPGGLGTWRAVRSTMPSIPGTTQFIDIPAGYEAGERVFRNNFDTATFGGAQPDGSNESTMTAFSFTVNMNIPILNWRPSIEAVFPASHPANQTAGMGWGYGSGGDFGANRLFYRLHDSYMIDIQNPTHFPLVIQHEDFERSTGTFPEFIGTTTINNLAPGGQTNNQAHNTRIGWFTHRSAAAMSASGAFAGTQENPQSRPDSEGYRSLHLTWSTPTAGGTVRIGQRNNFQPLNLTNYTHVRFWARANAAGTGPVSFVHRIDNNTDRNSATVNVTEEWQQFTIALNGTTGQRNDVRYIAFQAVRSGAVTGAELWIDEVEFVNDGDPVPIPAGQASSGLGTSAQISRVVMSRHPAVFPDRVFRIEFEVDTTHIFDPGDEKHPIQGLIFEAGRYENGIFVRSGIYYWQETRRVWSTEENAYVYVTVDMYNVDSDIPVQFHTFSPPLEPTPDGQIATIRVRAHDGREGGTWYPAPDGPDSYGEGPVSYRSIPAQNLVVNGVTVGTFTIEATSASPNPVPEGQGVTSITKLVTYTLNEGFIPYVQNMTANGNAVSGTGNTRTVSLTSGAPGPQNLATAFVFRIPD